MSDRIGMKARSTLRTGRDFTRVIRTGRRGNSDGITVYVAPGKGAGPARVGLSVRSVGSAVARNRVKRRMRVAWRQLQPAEGVDVVIQVDGRAATLMYQEMENHVGRALVAAGDLE